MLRWNPEQRAAIAAVDGFKREARKAEKQARPKSPKADRGRERDNGFLAFIRRQPCEARGKGGCAGPVQAAHIRYRVHGIPNSAGGQVKNHDRHCNPLCDFHHNHDQHKRREQDFWASVGKDAYETAAGHYARYLAGADAPTHRAAGQADSEEAGLTGYRGSDEIQISLTPKALRYLAGGEGS